MRHIPGETHCAACGKKLVANRFGFNDHKCKSDAGNMSSGDGESDAGLDSELSDKQKRRRKRRRERDSYSQRLGDGFLIQGMGGD